VGEAVEGVGGVFFRAHDPDALRAWYAEHLGIDMEDYGTTFTSKDGDQTVWAPFPADTTYFGTGGQHLMVNFRVRDVDDRVEEIEYGRFAWASDLEGNRFELWEPS